MVTVHPSSLLRLPDPESRAREYARFVADLKAIERQVPTVRLGPAPQPSGELGSRADSCSLAPHGPARYGDVGTAHNAEQSKSTPPGADGIALSGSSAWPPPPLLAAE